MCLLFNKKVFPEQGTKRRQAEKDLIWGVTSYRRWLQLDLRGMLECISCPELPEDKNLALIFLGLLVIG
jgi:hypothetical protein